MKMLLAASAMALAAGAADAAVFEYDFRAKMNLAAATRYDENGNATDYSGNVPAQDVYVGSIVIDTEAVVDRTAVISGSDSYTDYSAGVIMGGFGEGYEFRHTIRFDEAWNVIDWDLYAPDQNTSWIWVTGSHMTTASSFTNYSIPIANDPFTEGRVEWNYQGGPGQWTKTVRDETPSPVRLPASAFLLISGLCSVGFTRMRRD
ncbi:hypothetical protein QCN27_18010 [Cereibacter sp. SYSU M97828]|nr:hypothetical protein [Cereibacter flavus]